METTSVNMEAPLIVQIHRRESNSFFQAVTYLKQCLDYYIDFEYMW